MTSLLQQEYVESSQTFFNCTELHCTMHFFSSLPILLLPLASAAVLDARAATITKQGTCITKAPSSPQASAFLKVPIVKTFCSSFLKKTTTTTATANRLSRPALLQLQLWFRPLLTWS